MKKRLNNFNDYNADASSVDPYLRPTRRKKRKEREKRGCLARFLRTTALLFTLLIIAFGSFAALFYWRSVSAPIDAENASTGQLAGWLALRDLSAETPETRERLFDRYVETLEGDDGVVEPEKLELPEETKRFARLYFQRVEEAKKRQAQKEEKEKTPAPTRRNAKRAPYLRLDYYIAPRSADSTETSEYVVSSDVRPGPALLKRWNASRENPTGADAKRSQTPAVEKNVRLLVMQWFVAKRRAYDKAPDAEKQRRIDETIDELLGWQELYKKIQNDSEQTPTPRAQMLAEFEKTVESWNAIETPEELAKTLWFKDLIVAAVAARETPFGRLMKFEPPRARKSADVETAPRPTFDRVRQAAQDATDRFRLAAPKR